MKWVRDTTGRFAKRPHYLPEELDQECERVINDYLLKKYRRITFPVTTDDLTCLLERDVKDLDLYKDFSADDGQIEGVTEFRLGQRPSVKISARLTESPALENRLRTTLTHEFGHVHFHDHMFQVEVKPALLFSEFSAATETSHANRCHRDSMHSIDKKDWMEWQAGFVCGAILVPITPLISTVKDFRSRNGLTLKPIADESAAATDLTAEIAKTFQTSKDAARVRLLQKRILASNTLDSLL
jgi:hypothetical protein